jgi:prophage antirepressor-like protein
MMESQYQLYLYQDSAIRNDMNDKLDIFKYQGWDIRIVQNEKGEPLWVAKDVAEVMGYVWNGASRIAHVPEEWRGITSVVTPSGVQEMITLTEQGLYFFLGRSDKPAALPLQKWTTGEVLPSILKTGSYSIMAQVTKTYADALRLAASNV